MEREELTEVKGDAKCRGRGIKSTKSNTPMDKLLGNKSFILPNGSSVLKVLCMYVCVCAATSIRITNIWQYVLYRLQRRKFANNIFSPRFSLHSPKSPRHNTFPHSFFLVIVVVASSYFAP